MFVDIPIHQMNADCNQHRSGSGRRDCVDLKKGDIIQFPIQGKNQPCQITYIQFTPIIPGFWIEVILPDGSLEGRWFRETKVPEVVG